MKFVIVMTICLMFACGTMGSTLLNIVTQGERLPECSPTGNYYLPHPDNCGQFIQCYEGIRIIWSCAAGFYWNPSTEACDYPENVAC